MQGFYTTISSLTDGELVLVIGDFTEREKECNLTSSKVMKEIISLLEIEQETRGIKLRQSG